LGLCPRDGHNVEGVWAKGREKGELKMKKATSEGGLGLRDLDVVRVYDIVAAFH
jgi:hypothetical protein